MLPQWELFLSKPLLDIVLLEYGPNELMLCCGVRLAILRELLLQGFLQSGIPGLERYVGSEHISEPQVIAPLRVVYSHQVQMMRPDLRSRFFHEEIASSIPAHIASIETAEATERRPTLGNHRDRGHRHGNIKNRFRVETGYCSAPHMLDIQHKRLEVLVKDTPFLLEQVVPVRMIRNNLYSTSSQADHTSALQSHFGFYGTPLSSTANCYCQPSRTAPRHTVWLARRIPPPPYPSPSPLHQERFSCLSSHVLGVYVGPSPV